MIKRVVSIAESGEILPLPEIPILPKNISLGDRPIKEELHVINNHDLINHIKQYNFYFKR